MNKLIKWLKEEEGEVEDILLSPVEECLDVDAFGVSIIAGMTESGKTNLVKQIIRHNSQNYHKTAPPLIYKANMTAYPSKRFFLFQKKALKRCWRNKRKNKTKGWL